MHFELVLAVQKNEFEILPLQNLEARATYLFFVSFINTRNRYQVLLLYCCMHAIQE